MTDLLIAHTSDLHIGRAAGPERHERGRSGWSAFRRFVDATRPDLVVVGGDIVVDDPDDIADQREARNMIGGLPVPFVVVPGNHDVGDHPVRDGLPVDWHGKPVSESRVTTWEAEWGPSYWLHDLRGWRVVGINSQLFGSGLDREDQQWTWLEHKALPVDLQRPTLVVAHESLHLRPEHSDGTGGADSWMSMPRESSERLADLFRRRPVRLVSAGHTHRHLEWAIGGINQVTAPSLVGAIPSRPDMAQAQGDAEPGWLTYRLSRTGRISVTAHSTNSSPAEHDCAQEALT
ncbi:hypothetical protein ERC79_14330 [Rhodococcus sp. ABRD24]|uniref:metallophosphoesterase family protein n=1 Tax=Rhodococcus sp. ABRD24 TaxID=2507582 RepID=UPI00103FDE17|nr:metallophosphoesterase [Rhodococcus sp. ABRD24]QBJ96997.1 hypothetical protein ERC79_14330 [Rhodococcus sp. ABRD24]